MNKMLIKEIEAEIVEFLISTLENDLHVKMSKYNPLEFGEFRIKFVEETNDSYAYFFVTADGIDEMRIRPRRTWKKTPIKRLYYLLKQRKLEDDIREEKLKHEIYLSKLPKESQQKIDRRIKLNRLLK